MNGFTFKNRHSSEFGITFSNDNRVLMPQIRRNTINLKGRSGCYDFGSNVYEERTESFHCYFYRRGFDESAEQARQIAFWLSGTGPLIFDDEPNKVYNATVVNAPSLKRRVLYGEFNLDFKFNPPFALSKKYKQVHIENKSLPAKLTANNEGTFKTPCIIRIVAKEQINNITISAIAESK